MKGMIQIQHDTLVCHLVPTAMEVGYVISIGARVYRGTSFYITLYDLLMAGF